MIYPGMNQTSFGSWHGILYLGVGVVMSNFYRQTFITVCSNRYFVGKLAHPLVKATKKRNLTLPSNAILGVIVGEVPLQRSFKFSSHNLSQTVLPARASG